VVLGESNEGGLVLRRIGVVGDIHCKDEVLELVLRYFSELGIKTVLAVGDIVDGRGDANKVYSLLVKYEVSTVAGNHDRWILAGSLRELPDATELSALRSDTREWLVQLPKTRSFQTSRGPLLLCHGLGEDDMAGLWPGDEGFALQSNFALQALVESKRYRFVINGHTHLPMVRSVGPLTIINAGTLQSDRPVCSVIDFDRGKVKFFTISQGRISGGECFELP
jgi:putative phosphoesterase